MKKKQIDLRYYKLEATDTDCEYTGTKITASEDSGEYLLAFSNVTSFGYSPHFTGGIGTTIFYVFAKF